MKSLFDRFFCNVRVISSHISAFKSCMVNEVLVNNSVSQTVYVDSRALCWLSPYISFSSGSSEHVRFPPSGTSDGIYLQHFSFGLCSSIQRCCNTFVDRESRRLIIAEYRVREMIWLICFWKVSFDFMGVCIVACHLTLLELPFVKYFFQA